MDARLDTPFELSGGFCERQDGSQLIHGRLIYAPADGVKLELVEHPRGKKAFALIGEDSLGGFHGQLVDGTRVTLDRCFITNAALQIGIGVGSPTTISVHRALFGAHVGEIDELKLRRYSVELSSLANWAFAFPLTMRMVDGKETATGFDLTYRRPASIVVKVPESGFDLEISHDIRWTTSFGSFETSWSAFATIIVYEPVTLDVASGVARQFRNFMSLLVGQQLSMKSIALEPAEPIKDAPANQALRLIFPQIGKHDAADVHPALMLLPYELVKDQYSEMLKRWFERSEQATLATNVFFGSQEIGSPAVNATFLAMVQAAESYHRSLGTGIYMAQDVYDKEIAAFLPHLPEPIKDDHRHSLKNRLKYGNEYSLRKRLAEMFDRLPQNVRTSIAGNPGTFIAKVVDTRNYYTHYDHAAQANAFNPKEAYIAAERIRFLVVATLLNDLGMQGEKLMEALARSQDFQHWTSQPLPV